MKEKQKVIKLQLIAGKATSAPPLGPILSQVGINSNNFCKEYNEKTKNLLGKIIPIKLSIYNDKSYLIEYLTSPTSRLILDCLKLEKGSKQKVEIIGNLNEQDIINIFNQKGKEFNSFSFEKVKKMILGTAKNMGIKFL